MNKQKAIEKIEKLKGLTIKEKNLSLDIEMISKGDVLEIIEQIDEPEKPVIPKYVADWIEWCKKHKVTLLGSIIAICDNKNIRSLDASGWATKNQETFTKAWFYGYKVEKEKLYTVEIPNPNGDGYRRVYLGRNEYNKIKLHVWDCFPSIEFSNDWKQLDIAQLTEAEIKKDFDWAFRWAEEVEE